MKTTLSTYRNLPIEFPEVLPFEPAPNMLMARIPRHVRIELSKATVKFDGEEHFLELGDLDLHLEELPPQTIIYYLIYGIQQSIADGRTSATKNAETLAEARQNANALTEKRLAKHFAGDMSRSGGTRSRGTKSTSDYAIISRLFSKQLAALVKRETGLAKLPPVKEKDAYRKWTEAMAQALKTFSEAPKVKLAVKEEKARMAALAAEFGEDDGLDDLLSVDEPEDEAADVSAE